MEIQNIVDLKQLNVKNIISCIRFHDDQTKKQIANTLDLSFATVSNICNELRERGIVREWECSNSLIGRNPKLIMLNYDKYYMVCLDLHIKDIITITFVNMRNEMILQCVKELETCHTAEEYISHSYSVFLEQIGTLKIPTSSIIGIGVIVSGIFDNTTQNIICSEIELFENQPLKRLIKNIYSLPVYIDNESNLLVIAARLYNSGGKGNNNIIYIYISEGVGVGIISHGNLITGERGHGAEICHIPIGNMHYKCRFCNNWGCVENDLSLYGFVAKYLEEIDYNKSAALAKWSCFIEKVNQKEERALHVIEQNGAILGRLISVLTSIFDPGVIYIGGILDPIFNEIYPHITKEVDNRLVINKTIDIKADRRSRLLMIEGAAEMVFKMWQPLHADIRK